MYYIPPDDEVIGDAGLEIGFDTLVEVNVDLEEDVPVHYLEDFCVFDPKTHQMVPFFNVFTYAGDNMNTTFHVAGLILPLEIDGEQSTSPEPRESEEDFEPKPKMDPQYVRLDNLQRASVHYFNVDECEFDG